MIRKNKLRLLSALFLAIVLGIIYFVLVFSKSTYQTTSLPTTSSSVVSTDKDLVNEREAGWQVCNYSSFGFRLEYPSNWKVFVLPKSQGGSENGAIAITCDQINASALLGQVEFAPSSEIADETIKITIDKTKGTSDRALARQEFLNKGTAIYGDNRYSIYFGSKISTTTREGILSTFDFTN